MNKIMNKNIKKILSIIIVVLVIVTQLPSIKVNALTTKQTGYLPINNENLIINSSFEDGNNGWEISGNAKVLDCHPRDGKNYMALQQGSAKQTVTVPYTGYYNASAFFSTGYCNTKMMIKDKQSGQILTSKTIDLNPEYTVYHLEPVYLNAGQQIEVICQGEEYWGDVDSVELHYDNLLRDSGFENSSDNWQFVGAAGVNNNNPLKYNDRMIKELQNNDNDKDCNNHFYLGFSENGQSNEVKQVVKIPSTGYYRASAMVACVNYGHKLIIRDKLTGRELSYAEIDYDEEYKEYTTDYVYLEENQEIEVVCVSGYGWVNGDNIKLSYNNLIKNPDFNDSDSMSKWNFVGCSGIGNNNQVNENGNHFYSNIDDKSSVYQLITIPTTGYYVASANLSACGLNSSFSISKESTGEILASAKIASDEGYKRYELEPVYLQKGDVVRISCIGTAWLNGDNFVLKNETNLIKNGDVESIQNGIVANWSFAQSEDKSEGIYTTIGGIGKSKALIIESTKEENYARYIQEVQLEPNTRYIFKGYVAGTDIQGSGKEGAGLYVDGAAQILTNTEQKKGSFYYKLQQLEFITSEDGRVKLQCRLGDNDSKVKGTAFFDNLTLEKNNGVNVNEGKNVVLQFDDKHLTNVTQNDYDNFLNSLDVVYDKYSELLGGYKPFGGRKITITPNYDSNYYGGYAWSGNPVRIMAGANNVVYDYASQGGWSFGLLHELGHDFDYNKYWCWSSWCFDCDLMANFKMVYVLEKLNEDGYDAKIRFVNEQNNVVVEEMTCNGQQMINYYKTGLSTSSASYDKCYAIKNGEYSGDALVYLLLNIKNKVGWDPYIKTFKQYIENESTICPKYEIQKLDKFLQLLQQNYNPNGKEIYNEFNEVGLDYIRFVFELRRVRDKLAGENKVDIYTQTFNKYMSSNKKPYSSKNNFTEFLQELQQQYNNQGRELYNLYTDEELNYIMDTVETYKSTSTIRVNSLSIPNKISQEVNSNDKDLDETKVQYVTVSKQSNETPKIVSNKEDNSNLQDNSSEVGGDVNKDVNGTENTVNKEDSQTNNSNISNGNNQDNKTNSGDNTNYIIFIFLVGSFITLLKLKKNYSK